MNNRTFIEKAFYGLTSKQSHGNLFKDGFNNIYSYGYHYPLLFTAEDNSKLVFINVSGYSNSTAKHINHAKEAVDYKYIGIKLTGRQFSSGFTLQYALELLTKERDELKLVMEGKKRKDTQVYSGLEAQIQILNISIRQIKDEM